MTGDPLLRFRREFPILEKSTYLISNSLGAMPLGAEVALSEYARNRAFDVIDEIRASRAWERWSDRPTVVT